MRRLALTALLLLISRPAAAAGVVSGIVRSAAGAGLPGMHVEAWSAAGFLASATTSTGTGAWALSLAPGSYRFLAYDAAGTYATDYYRQASSFETSTLVALSDCSTLSAIDFTLNVAGVLSGIVRDASTLAPLSGVAAVAYNLDGTVRTRVATNGFGAFRLALPAGAYKLGAADESRRYAPTFAIDAERFEDAATFTVSAGQTLANLLVSMPRAAVVAGTVRAAASGALLSGQRVELYTLDGQRVAAALTAGDGRYTIVTRPGVYRVVASDPAQAFRTAYYGAPSFEASPGFELAPGQTLGGVDFALASGFSSTVDESFVVAAAHAAGANGTFFTTELFASNPSAARTVAAVFTWLPSGGGDNSGAPPVTVTVAPGATTRFADVVDQLFGASGGGAIRVVADAPLQVFTRTSTPALGAGSYGLGVPALSRSRSLARGRLVGLTSDQTFRTNVGFLNPGSSPLTITLTLLDGAGSVLATGGVSLGALGHFQASTIAAYLGVAELRGGSLRMEAPGPFFAYATIIDQATGDSAFEAAEPE